MKELKETYDSLDKLYSNLKLKNQFIAADYESLNDYLIALSNLKEAIASIKPSPFDVTDSKKYALRLRAAAWLLGWASFSKLITFFSRQNIDEEPQIDKSRSQLILLSDGSALSLLLTIYAQIVESDQEIDEPLQYYLVDRTGIGAFPYREKIDPQDPNSDWYIPSSTDLLGTYHDSPAGKYDILSFWGLVNLQLDTWHTAAPVYTEQGCQPPSATVTSNSLTLELTKLTEWLESLNTNGNLSSLGQTSSFIRPIGKMIEFLRFREQFSSESKLKELCANLRIARIKESLEIPEPIASLKEAATPEENGERLYDAAIWLRYVLLLSFEKERSIILDDSATNNLENTWKKISPNPGERFSPTIDVKRNSSTCAPFLRWNSVPFNGTISAVIGDLTEATYSYLKSERNIQDIEQYRFQTVIGAKLKTTGSKYVKRLEIPLQELKEGFNKSVQPYFPVPQKAASVGNYDPAEWGDPTMLSSSDSDWRVPLRTSGTGREQIRLMEDLGTIAREIKSTTAKYELIRQAYGQVSNADVDLSDLSVVLKSLGGLTALSNWNLYQLPSRQFNRYKKDFDDAIKKLTFKIDSETLKAEMRKSFALKRKDVEEVYYTLLAAKLGSRVAEQSIKISQIYQRISELDIQITDLDIKISRLNNEGWMTEKQMSGAKLAYEIRKKDLAAAGLEALIKASQEVYELAKQAEEELRVMAEQLTATAIKIKDGKPSSIFGILKLVVSVVGAVFAPMTGGATLAIATLVNKGIDIYEQASKMDWSSLTNAIGNLGELGPQLAEGVNFAVQSFGSEQLKRDFNKVSAFVKSASERFQHAAQSLNLSENPTVKAVLQAVNEFKKNNNVLNFAAAIANGYVFSIDGDRIALDFRGSKITFKNENLRKNLLDLYAAGHIIINDATARAEKLTSLVALPDDELRQKLHEAFQGAVGQLPLEFLEKLNLKVEEAKQMANTALDRIRITISNELSSEELRLFAQLLAGGFLFVKDGEVIVAVEPSPITAADKFKKRLEAYQERIQFQIVTDFMKYWTEKSNALQKTAQELSSGEDDEGLRQFANNLHTVINDPVNGIRVKLLEIRNKIEEAKEELEDKETEVEITNYEAKANELFASASEISVQQADLKAEQSKLKLEEARKLYLKELTKEEQASALVQAELRRAEASELAMIQAYERCLSMGVNPMSLTSDFNYLEGSSIKHVLANFLDLKYPTDGSLVDNAASNLVGMIQWASLLGVHSDDKDWDATEFYFKLIESLTRGTTQDAGAENLKEKLIKIQEKVEVAVKKLDLDQDVPQLFNQPNIPFDNILWLDRPELNDEEREKLKPLIEAERYDKVSRIDKFGKRVIGALRVIVDLEGLNNPLPDKSIRIPLQGDIGRMFYVDLDEVYPLSKNGTGLFYLVSPPLMSYSYPNTLTYGMTELNLPDHISSDPEIEALEKKFKDKFGEFTGKLKLTGALGEWTVFILTQGTAPTLAQRLKVVRTLRDEQFTIDNLLMGFIQIPIPQ